jgi:hypothetical protein
VEPDGLQHEVLHEQPDQEDLGVGEVDQSEHAVDQRVPDRDQGVDRAVGQAVNGQPGEVAAQRPRIELDPVGRKHLAGGDGVHDLSPAAAT